MIITFIIFRIFRFLYREDPTMVHCQRELSRHFRYDIEATTGTVTNIIAERKTLSKLKRV